MEYARPSRHCDVGASERIRFERTATPPVIYSSLNISSDRASRPRRSSRVSTRKAGGGKFFLGGATYTECQYAAGSSGCRRGGLTPRLYPPQGEPLVLNSRRYIAGWGHPAYIRAS